MRAIARALRAGWQRIRFRLWVVRVRLELGRCDGRLVIEAPNGVAFDSAPRINSTPQGEGTSTLTLRFGRNVRLGRHMTIEVWAHGDNMLELGDDCTFLNGVRVALRSGSVRFGSRCLIKDGVWIKSDGDLVTGDVVTLGPHA